MGWFTNNDPQPPARAGTCALAALLSAALLFPLQALALDVSPSGMKKLSDDELRRIAAQGLADRFLQRISLYAANGMGIEVIGDMASLLNPFDAAFAGLIDADVTFRDAAFNPTNPSLLINSDGSSLIRLPSTIGELNIRNIRIRGSNGASFGSVTIRNVTSGGSTIRVTPH